MQEFFGVISPALLVATVTAATQIIKQWFNLDGVKVRAVALCLSYLALTPYQLITQWMAAPPETTVQIAWLIFQALFYPLLGWLMADGSYNLLLKPLKNE